MIPVKFGDNPPSALDVIQIKLLMDDTLTDIIGSQWPALRLWLR